MQNERELKPNYEYDFKTGHVFGRLTLTGVSYFKEIQSGRRRMVTAKCQCGVIADYVFDSVKRGYTHSCGCLKTDRLKQFPNARTHGLKYHPIYRVWDGMKQRCYNPNHEGFEYWGGKGIIVCPQWKDDFKTFFDWAILNGWRKGLTIERRKSEFNYEPSNCYFATYRAQRMNMDDIKAFFAWGEKKTAIQWSEDPRCKVTYGGLRNRLNRDKVYWSDIEKAISTPPTVRKQNKSNRVDARMVFAFGEEKSLAMWLVDERCIADEGTIRLRLRKGWDAEKAITTFQRKKPTK